MSVLCLMAADSSSASVCDVRGGCIMETGCEPGKNESGIMMMEILKLSQLYICS